MSLDARAQRSLQGVHFDFIKVVRRTDIMCPFPFTCVEGPRSLARQRKLMAEGKSHTLRSRHLTGHAGDLVPLTDDDKDGDLEPSWAHWPLFFELARHVQEAAKGEGVEIEWGGCWDRKMSQISDDMEFEMAQYIQRFKMVNPLKKAFVDGPHFQLAWENYPVEPLIA